MKTFTNLGTEIGALVEQKNAAYGSSFAVAGDFLRLLFPKGIPADRFDDALLMARIFDKQMRIATDQDAFGESPYQDIAGYGILGLHLQQRKKESTTWPGSANVPDASSSSKAQPISAAQPTGAKTTTSANEDLAGRPLLLLSDYFVRPTSASAPTAMEDANVSAAVRVRLERNKLFLCAAGCGNTRSAFVRGIEDHWLLYCSFSCAKSDRPEEAI